MLTSPRKDAGLVAIWNRKIGQSLQAINERDSRRYNIKNTGLPLNVGRKTSPRHDLS
jgi:hypothetical protein